MLGRTKAYAGNPGVGYTVNGTSGSNAIVNNGGVLSSVSTPAGTYAGGFSGNITLNSGAKLNPGGVAATGVISSNSMTINAGRAATLILTSGSHSSLFDSVFLNGGAHT